MFQETLENRFLLHLTKELASTDEFYAGQWRDSPSSIISVVRHTNVILSSAPASEPESALELLCYAQNYHKHLFQTYSPGQVQNLRKKPLWLYWVILWSFADTTINFFLVRKGRNIFELLNYHSCLILYTWQVWTQILHDLDELINARCLYLEHTWRDQDHNIMLWWF